MRLLVVFSLFLLNYIDAAQDCSSAPTPALKILCNQIKKWDSGSRAAPQVTAKMALPPALPGMPPMPMAAELAPIARTAGQCMDLGCLCGFMGGNGSPGSNACSLSNGQTLKKALRKELRMMSNEERQRYHFAVQKLKANGEIGNFARLHSQFATSGSAHSGPAFLPWHREFLKRYEIALRQIDPTVALPYWDSTLESGLPTPADSIIFSDIFFGETNGAGFVVSGPFKGFTTMAGAPNIKRAVGAQGTVFQQTEYNYIMQQTSIGQILSFTAPKQGCSVQIQWNALEYTHGNVHLFVGGDMFETSTAGNDPGTFMTHHAFIDLIWENWRQAKQNRFEREQAYPTNNMQCSSANHFGAAIMQPFAPWTNIDGLNNKYTDNMFAYGSRPTCGPGNPMCGSEFLFCDTSKGTPRCLSKVKPGGNCKGLESNPEVCYNGDCINSKCKASMPQPITTPKPIVLTTRKPTIIRESNCYNENECCQTWSIKGECQKNANWMNLWCSASCKKCAALYPMNVECDDRHSNCVKWSRSGECSKNAAWMTENCRKSCAKCGQTRAQKCGPQTGATKAPVQVKPRPVGTKGGKDQSCKPFGCFDENPCCSMWSFQGLCRANAFMACNCRVSCGFCVPTDYYFGSCNNYHKDCDSWANQGECEKNKDWMLANCKASSACDSCFSDVETRRICMNNGRAIGGFENWEGNEWGQRMARNASSMMK
uniref:ShKT domain-containing protein n=1 Tax=Rhabditophanes sp. KR3021 TaxID=114890 RepID=A0AC35TI99_9BILA